MNANLALHAGEGKLHKMMVSDIDSPVGKTGATLQRGAIEGYWAVDPTTTVSLAGGNIYYSAAGIGVRVCVRACLGDFFGLTTPPTCWSFSLSFA